MKKNCAIEVIHEPIEQTWTFISEDEKLVEIVRSLDKAGKMRCRIAIYNDPDQQTGPTAIASLSPEQEALILRPFN